MTGFNFVGRHSIYNLDLTVVDGSGVVVDADALPTAAFKNWASNALIFTRATTKIALGTYRLTISSAESANPGLYYVVFDYALSGIAQQYRSDIEIPATTSSLYESLSAEFREVIENVWDRFEDLVDSPLGGPHLVSYAQSQFGRERVAQLMRVALGLLNTTAQPWTTYSLTEPFPFAQWGAVLEQATSIEVIKHLMRSYVEQPSADGVQVARMDRRDYLSRWEQILRIEQSTLDAQLDVFKMSHMNLGKGSILVAGGAFGEVPLSLRHTRLRGYRW